MKMPHILLIYTGGTIGMIRDFNSGTLRSFNFDELLKHIPELNLLDCTIETQSLAAPIDSSNMTPEIWVQLAHLIEENYNHFDGFVILHGSDTMSYSASALSFMLEGLIKPVIFTGSQLPIGDLRTDAKENLITAIQIAAMREADQMLVQEVCVYFEYKLYRGNRTTKINAEHFQAFASFNYPSLAESGVNLAFNKTALFRSLGRELRVQTKMHARIALIKLFPGMTQEVFEQMLLVPRLEGVILETFGSGNVPNRSWLNSALENTIAKGVPVVSVTQCSGGSVQLGMYETSEALVDMGVISGFDMTTETALAKMAYLLGEGKKGPEFKQAYESPLRGEITKN
ncbi:MAG: asparaginase [Flavobacteriaceae bacterium]|nr:asparaginase [Flavobacteriaceae bacterium]MDG1962754.1 asparaginase [Flavobacteriaceae bacterium]